MPKAKRQLNATLMRLEPIATDEAARPRRNHVRRGRWIPAHDYNQHRREEFEPQPEPKRRLRDKLRRRG